MIYFKPHPTPVHDFLLSAPIATKRKHAIRSLYHELTPKQIDGLLLLLSWKPAKPNNILLCRGTINSCISLPGFTLAVILEYVGFPYEEIQAEWQDLRLDHFPK